MQENADTNGFLDVFNMLEKKRYWNQADFWIELRKIRNYGAHDYPENDQTTIESITIFTKAVKLWLYFFTIILRS